MSTRPRRRERRSKSCLAAALLVAPLLAAPLAGCERTDPYQRAGLWQPDGAPIGNLAAMLADPRDLRRGHDDGADNGDSRLATDAVLRLWEDRTRPFIGSVGPAAAGGSGPAAAPPAAPGQPDSGGGNGGGGTATGGGT